MLCYEDYFCIFYIIVIKFMLCYEDFFCIFYIIVLDNCINRDILDALHNYGYFYQAKNQVSTPYAILQNTQTKTKG